MNEFIDAIVDAGPGASIVYATGDLALSAQWSQELIETRAVARRFHDQGRGQLVERRKPDLRFIGTGGGCCFDYLFVKARAEA